MNLTAQQQAVVDSEAKKIVVLSCAGSGKTTVITQRIMRLCEQGIDPQSILVLTFSSKAAGEMRLRIQRENPAVGKKISGNVKTFHAFGLDIIKKFADALGYDGKIDIIKEKELRTALTNLSKTTGKPLREVSDLLRYIRKKKSFDYCTYIKEYDDIYQKYSEYIQEKSLVDWDDMIWIPVQFLSANENARHVLSEQYQYVFVDEYQDTNEGQNRLLDLITDNDSHLCLVGDDDQAIYEWRGAKPKYIRDKANSNEYTLLRLETNFRSQNEIVQAANAIIKNNKNRISKTISAHRQGGVVPLFKWLPDQNAEADYVAERISDLVRGGKYNASDIAILVRNNRQMPVIESALKDAGLEYDTCEYDENSQYTQFIHVLQAICKLESSNDLADALNFPERCFDRFVFEDAKNLYCDTYGQDCNYPTLEWINRLYLSDIEFENSSLFRERYALITQLHTAVNWRPTQVISLYINYFQNRGYDTLCPEKYHFVLQVFEIAKNYEESFEDASLNTFVEHLILTLEENHAAPSISLDSVNILSMHRAKGLEFKVVFLVGIQVGEIPNEYFIQSDYDIETERRLFYVAITRAKDLLFITSYQDPFGASGSSLYVHHGFMAELPKLSYSTDFDFESVLYSIPNTTAGDREKSTIDYVTDVVQQTVLPIEAELPAISESDLKSALSADKDTISLKNLTKDQVDSFFEQSLALSNDIQLPEDKFIVMIGDSDLKLSAVKALFKANSINKYELYDYDGKGFNINRLTNNYKCAGIILGPMAHKIESVDAPSLKSKILSAPEAFPYMVDLIDRRISKRSLQEAIVKIKWNYSQSEISSTAN